MAEVHAFATPNSVKVPIALEEMGLAYKLLPVNVRNGEQKAESFIALNPNAKVPVLVDDRGGDRFVLSESAAILVYLAETSGELLPSSGAARARVFKQLFFHASALSRPSATPASSSARRPNRSRSPRPALQERPSVFLASSMRS